MGILGVLALVFSLASKSKAAEALHAPAPVRQHDAVCGTCHPNQFRNFLKTPMANASGAAVDRVFTGRFHQVSSGVDYEVAKEQDSLWLKFSRASDPPLNGKHKLDYFLGSGHLGITYLYSLNGYLLESPAAYYAGPRGYDMKPGLADLATMPSALPMTRGCMRCHMSGVQREDAGTVNHFRDLPFLYGGITCESCHGEARQHAASGGKAPIVNPAKLTPERRDSVCISCHLEGDTRIEHAGRNVDDFTAGDRINDYLAYFVFSNDRLTSRAVTEIEQLTFSQCKRVSGDRMSCMSCHDPHNSPSAEEKVAFYRGKCLQCHSEPNFAESHFSGNPDCIGCHMPKDTAERVPHIAWTDHQIRRHPQTSSGDVTGTRKGELVSFLDADPSARDLALAYYDLLLAGNASLKDTAWHRLSAVHDPQKNDLAVATSLGYLAQLRGENTQAIALYREALAIDPVNVDASNNLAVLLARSGQLNQAEALWRKVFSRNEDLDQPGINLALVECLIGKKDDAAHLLERVLLYSPDQKLARRKLLAIQSGQETCSPPPDSAPR